MADSLRELRSKIKSTESMKKITRAMELIAASRIVKAQQRARAAAPYARELTRSVEAIATYANVDHPLTTEPENVGRAAVLVITSDRGLAGAYSTSVLKEAESLIARLRQEGKEIELYVTGRKAQAYYSFRDRAIVDSWTGFSDQPAYSDAKAIGEALIASFLRDEDEEAVEDEPGGKGVGEVHVVFTKFQSMISQQPITVRMLPLEIVEADEAPADSEVLPLYEFEPSASEVLDSLLPKYVQSRIYFALLQAAASELAARQKAMKSATDNAEDLIEKYKRVANQARQAAITQEISEIVGGVEALSGSNGRGE